MTTLDQRSTAELRRLRDRATNETIRELLNAELTKRFYESPATLAAGRKGQVWEEEGFRKVTFYPNPGQP